MLLAVAGCRRDEVHLDSGRRSYGCELLSQQRFTTCEKSHLNNVRMWKIAMKDGKSSDWCRCHVLVGDLVEIVMK